MTARTSCACKHEGTPSEAVDSERADDRSERNGQGATCSYDVCIGGRKAKVLLEYGRAIVCNGIRSTHLQEHLGGAGEDCPV